jgi:hypothetical protein
MTTSKYYIAFILLVLALTACKDPLEGVTISIKDPIASSTVKIYYVNGNYADTARIPKNLKISIIGPDADKIVNSTGSKKISVSKEGLLGVAVSPDYTTRPVKFKIIGESDGFLTSIEEIEISGTGNITRTAQMFKFSNLPNGMNMAIGTLTSGSGGSAALTFGTSGKGEQATMTVPVDIITKDKAGQNVEGKLTWVLNNYSNAARNYVPSSYTFYNAIDLNNKILKPFDFNPFGFFSISIFNEKFEQVSSFSKPVQVMVELNENTLKLDGTKLKVGDTVPFWGFINGTWKLLANVVLGRNDSGKLFASVSVTNATYFAFGEMIEICDKGLSFTINSKLNAMDTYYLAKFLDVKTGGQVRAFYTSFNNGTNVSVTGLRPYPNKVTMQLFNYNNHYGGDPNVPIYKSEPFDVCEDKKISVNVTIPEPKSVTLEITIKCPVGKVLDESQFPAVMQLQYQLSGSNPNNWTDLLTLTRTVRKVTTYKLQLGSKYNLRATTNAAQGWPFLQRDTTIKQDYFLLKLDGQGYCK